LAPKNFLTNKFTVDFGLISATSRDLSHQIAEGAFREDFFYRINVIRIDIPPLRRRKKNIALLVAHFLEKVGHETTRKVDRISPGALEALAAYDWPGNVRELENAVERAVVLAKSRTLGRFDFAFLQASAASAPAADATLKEVEAAHIRKVLADCGGNVTRAARIPGINRVTLHKKINWFFGFTSLRQALFSVGQSNLVGNGRQTARGDRLIRSSSSIFGKPCGMLCIGLLVAVLGLTAGCGQDSGAPPRTANGEAGVETFTFFGLGRQSVLDEAARDRLKKELGAEAVARRGLVDLEFQGPRWLARYLPDLDRLNRRLNNDFRERVEYDVLTLRYNYPTRNSPAFEKLRLVFDGKTRHPLYFEILANAAGAGILQVLEDKYGPPVDRGEKGEKVLLWEKNGDRLVVLLRINRLGRPEYLIGIYFVSRIESLLKNRTDGRGGKTGGGVADAF
jgi:hypothetical protein